MLRTFLLLAIAAVTPCAAAVVYQLTGTSPNGQQGTFNLDFTLERADFITSSSEILAIDFQTCNSGFESCSSVAFDPVSPHNATSTSLEFKTPSSSTLFFFDLGAFGAVGVYNTTFGAGTGTLTVTETAAVPEPASLTMIGLGAAALAGLRRSRKK